MSKLKVAIEELRKRRLEVYRIDPTRLARDASSARSVARDHGDRWILELIQNSDDANARNTKKTNEVLIQVTDGAIYVADDGHGIKPSAVESISGTYFSDKPPSAIGHKGLGFKAVYEVSSSPSVYSGHDGIVFSEELARDVFSESSFTRGSNHVPFEWIPFWESRTDAENKDPTLKALAKFRTVVKLPLDSTREPSSMFEMLRQTIPMNVLLTLNHLKRICIRSAEQTFEIECSRGRVWTIRDTRNKSDVRWRVTRKSKQVPQSVLVDLEEGKDRERAKKVKLLVAAPTDARDCCRPVNDARICVYYPTEDLSPVPLVLHADLLVSSDRTRIIPLNESKYNAWVADCLAELVIEFINKRYCPAYPAANICLLEPLAQLQDHPCAQQIWTRIAEHGKTKLLLPNISGDRELVPNQAFVVEATANRDARSILEADGRICLRLVQKSVEAAPKIRRTLTELGCSIANDRYVLESIRRTAGTNRDNHDWLWTCWRWLAEWYSNGDGQHELENRLVKICALPILPLTRRTVAPDSVSKESVTWRDDNSNRKIPNWLSVQFLANWFRDQVLNDNDTSNSVKSLLECLGIQRGTPHLLLDAMGAAIERFWESPDDKGGRFYKFLLDAEIPFRRDKVSQSLLRCPVPVKVNGERKTRWVAANTAYFGSDWGENLIAEVYGKQSKIAWVWKLAKRSIEKQREVLARLGVEAFPRVVESDDSAPTSLKLQMLDGLDVKQLSEKQMTALTCLLAQNWREYYRGRAFKQLSYDGDRDPAKWWKEIEKRIVALLRPDRRGIDSLEQLWIPGDKSLKSLMIVLPVVDLGPFRRLKGGHPDVEHWLRHEIRLRTKADQVTAKEWREILTREIPARFPATNGDMSEKGSRAVSGCYDVALKCLGDLKLNEICWSDVPLLCRKDGQSKYVAEERRFLVDDAELGKIMQPYLWQIDFSRNLHEQAHEIFSLEFLSDVVKNEVRFGEVHSSQSKQLQKQLDGTMPYIFAWQCHGDDRGWEELRRKLKELHVEVVSSLNSFASMDGIEPVEYRKRYFINGTKLLFSEGNAKSNNLATALADSLGKRHGSEADLFENLLGYETDDERKRKLEERGCSQNETKRWLAEYADSEIELPMANRKPVPKFAAIENSSSDSGNFQPEIDTPPAEYTRADSQPAANMGIRLKTLTDGHIILAPHTGRTNPASSKRRSTKKRPSQNNRAETNPEVRLTQEQKLKIELESRQCATIELKKLGYRVEEMAQDHPGFDLRATNGDKILLVEVKGHLNTKKLIGLTGRQFEKYLRCQQGANERWELWNVENLSAEAPERITITVYDTIPENALRCSSYQVDLTRCARTHD